MDPDDRRVDPSEERLRARLRLVGALTFLALIVVLSLADTFDADLHASEFILGSLFGSFLLLVGVEGAARLFGRK